MDSEIIGKMLGKTLQNGGPLIVNPIYTPYIVGIYWLYPLLKGSNKVGSTARGPPSQDIPPSTTGSKDEFPEWSRIISMAGIQPANVG